KADALTGLRYTPKIESGLGRLELGLNLRLLNHVVYIAVAAVWLLRRDDDLRHLLRAGLVLEDLVAERLFLCHRAYLLDLAMQCMLAELRVVLPELQPFGCIATVLLRRIPRRPWCFGTLKDDVQSRVFCFRHVCF